MSTGHLTFHRPPRPGTRAPATLSSAQPGLPRRRSHLDWISAQVSDVLDPLAARCAGWPLHAVRVALERAWHDAFGAELGEPGLTDTATAICDRQPWTRALWPDGW